MTQYKRKKDGSTVTRYTGCTYGCIDRRTELPISAKDGDETAMPFLGFDYKDLTHMDGTPVSEENQ